MILSRRLLTARTFGLTRNHTWRDGGTRRVSTQAEEASLQVSPAYSLLDTPCCIKGRNLPPESTVTLTTNLINTEERFDFTSINRFKVNKFGSFDTTKQPPLDGGSYEGIHSMGPLWSMRPNKDARTRMWPYDITAPLNYHLTLSDHNDNILASTEMKKTYVTEGVEKIEVKEGRIRGSLFLPPLHQRPSPVIITVYGGLNRGKVVEDRSAMLASHGFASLALAYFGVDDLPKFYNELDIEYFEEAVDLLADHPDVDSEGGVGIYGASIGGDIAIVTAACLGTKIRAVVAAGAPLVGGVNCNMRYRGELLSEPTVPEDYNWMADPPYVYNQGLKQEVLANIASKQIKFSHASADLLVIEGEEDPAMCSKTFSKESIDRAKMEGKTNCSLVTYPGMGHLVDLPYSPVCLAQGNANPLLPPGYLIHYGGHLQQHALGQITAWQDMLEFFKNAMYTKR